MKTFQIETKKVADYLSATREIKSFRCEGAIKRPLAVTEPQKTGDIQSVAIIGCEDGAQFIGDHDGDLVCHGESATNCLEPHVAPWPSPKLVSKLVKPFQQIINSILL